MTTAYRSLSPEALRREYAEVSARFDALRGLGLALNMARGKPVKAQLDAGMSDAEAFDLLATNGMLVKRPLVVGEDFVLVGFKEPEWSDRLL